MSTVSQVRAWCDGRRASPGGDTVVPTSQSPSRISSFCSDSAYPPFHPSQSRLRCPEKRGLAHLLQRQLHQTPMAVDVTDSRGVTVVVP